MGVDARHVERVEVQREADSPTSSVKGVHAVLGDPEGALKRHADESPSMSRPPVRCASRPAAMTAATSPQRLMLSTGCSTSPGPMAPTLPRGSRPPVQAPDEPVQRSASHPPKWAPRAIRGAVSRVVTSGLRRPIVVTGRHAHRLEADGCDSLSCARPLGMHRLRPTPMPLTRCPAIRAAHDGVRNVRSAVGRPGTLARGARRRAGGAEQVNGQVT